MWSDKNIFSQNPRSQGLFLSSPRTLRSTRNIGPLSTQIHSFIYTWMYRRRRYCLFLILRKSYLWFGLLVISVIGCYHSRSRNHELKSGVPFKCFIYQSYSKFRSKVVCFLSDHLLFCNGFGFVIWCIFCVLDLLLCWRSWWIVNLYFTSMEKKKKCFNLCAVQPLTQ